MKKKSDSGYFPKIYSNTIMEDYADHIKSAVEMRKLSYCPYSHFSVGAVLVTTDGKVYKGCNIENAAYSTVCCAERTAIFKAISEGEKSFKFIVVTGALDTKPGSDLCTPCGTCRQVIREFCDPDFKIICPQVDGAGNITDCRIYTLEELLPDSFGPENLK